jgi:hypothetical protein
MDYSASPPQTSWKILVFGAVVALAVIGIVLLFIRYKDTRPVAHPLIQGFTATHGTGTLACGHESMEAEKLMGMFETADVSHTDDGAKDRNSLKNLLSKLTCFKRDLQSPGHIISATKEVKFDTYQDIQNLADTTAQCFGRSIPERDLQIQFDKWGTYGRDLLKRLCTATDMHEGQVDEALDLFSKVLADVQAVAFENCIERMNDPRLSPRDPRPIMSADVKNLRDYKESEDL